MKLLWQLVLLQLCYIQCSAASDTRRKQQSLRANGVLQEFKASSGTLLAQLGKDLHDRLLRSAAENPAIAELSQLALTSSLDPKNAGASLMKMESFLINFARGAKRSGISDNQTELIKQIAVILEESMKKGILSQLRIEQGSYDMAVKAFSSCETPLNQSGDAFVVSNKSLDKLSAVHRECRFNQSHTSENASGCNEQLAIYLKQYELAKLSCVNDTKTVLPISMPAQGQALCNNRNGDTGTHYKNLYEYWQSYLDKLVSSTNQTCGYWEDLIANQTTSCAALNGTLFDKRQDCDAAQTRLDNSACQMVQGMETSCSSYATCYEAALKHYQNVNTTVTLDVHSLKVEWEAVLRIECLLDSFSAENIEAAIDECRFKSYNTDVISVTFTTPPGDLLLSEPFTVTCGNLTEAVPVTISYWAHYFAGIPATAKPLTRSPTFCPSKAGGEAAV